MLKDRRFLDGIAQDVRYAARALRRTPGVTLTAIATLALGIGVNAAVFTVMKAAWLAGFPMVERNDRIAYIVTGINCCASYADFLDWRAQSKSFTNMAIVHGVRKILESPGGFAESYDATEVSADAFRLVGQKPVLGRDFSTADEAPGAPPVVILTYGFWERRFARDAGIVGRTVRMNGAPATVIGIMPQGFSFPQKQDLWVPLVPTPEVLKRDNRNTWFVFGRLAEGVSLETARAEMETIGRQLGNQYPLTNQGPNLVPHVLNFRQFFFFPEETPMFAFLWGAVGFVWLIACANLANLMLARAMGRSREISLRMALGAGRWRVVRQLLLESVMLSALGGALGWWIAGFGVQAYAFADRGPGRSAWRILDYSMDYRVLGYLVAISIATAFLFGLAPALRISKLDVNEALKDGGRGAIGGRPRRLSDLLVAGEMALAVLLLVGAGVMIRSFLNIYTADLGFRTRNILTVSLTLPQARYPTADAQAAFFQRLTEWLETIPGVESAAIAFGLPTDGAAARPFEIAGAPAASGDEQHRPMLAAALIGPDYFRTLGVPLLSGREFSSLDGPSAAPVVIVGRRFADQYWPRQDPLGKHLRIFEARSPLAAQQQPWLTVIGMAPNIAQRGATRKDIDPVVYLPYRQRPAPQMEVMARTGVPPAGFRNAFRREMRALDPDLPLFGPFTLAERLEGTYWSRALYGALFLIFAAIAVLLASVGLYAVIAHAVGQRTQEIGIRMAIGASAPDIFRLVFRQGMLPVALGLMVGLAASLALNGLLQAALVQVSPSDPLTLFAAAATLLLFAALGCLIPARRALRVDPAVALRHD